MFEVIIKVLNKEEGEHRAISKAITDALEPFKAVLKIATKQPAVEAKDGVKAREAYSNEIYQIGEAESTEKHWKVTKK